METVGGLDKLLARKEHTFTSLLARESLGNLAKTLAAGLGVRTPKQPFLQDPQLESNVRNTIPSPSSWLRKTKLQMAAISLLRGNIALETIRLAAKARTRPNRQK